MIQQPWNAGGMERAITPNSNHKPQTRNTTHNMKLKNKITLGLLCESSNIPASLIRAVVRQMGGWNSFIESAPDIARHGIDGGFSGFIYYSDTEPFAKRNRADIAAMASQQADDFGTGVIEMIRNFGCFRGQKISDEEIGSALYAGRDLQDGANVLNALAWYAGEEVARAYCDLVDAD